MCNVYTPPLPPTSTSTPTRPQLPFALRSFFSLEKYTNNNRVTRVAGPGQPQGKSLIGEEEIVQTLLEGINTVAYPKAFVQRKKLKKAATPDISVEAVKEAMAKAGASATPGAEAAAVESKESLPLPGMT